MTQCMANAAKPATFFFESPVLPVMYIVDSGIRSFQRSIFQWCWHIYVVLLHQLNPRIVHYSCSSRGVLAHINTFSVKLLSLSICKRLMSPDNLRNLLSRVVINILGDMVSIKSDIFTQCFDVILLIVVFPIDLAARIGTWSWLILFTLCGHLIASLLLSTPTARFMLLNIILWSLPRMHY